MIQIKNKIESLIYLKLQLFFIFPPLFYQMKKIETLSTNNLEKFQKEKLKHKIEPSKNKNFKGEFGEKNNN